MTSLPAESHAAHERELFMELIGLLSAGTDCHEMIAALLPLLQHWSGCQAVGIRLNQGCDYPYYETRGFPEAFVKLESSLCAKDENGLLLTGDDGKAMLECLCGVVIRGVFDASQPYFTPRGSFWVNETTSLMATIRRQDLPPRTRNRCNRAGYESVALVPLRFRSETFGLLQFNDKRKNRFSPQRLTFLEKLADNVALALSRFRAETALKESEEQYRAMFYANNAIKLLIEPDTGAIVDANPAACEYYGYPCQTITGMRIFDINPMPADLMLKEMAKAKAAKRNYYIFKHRMVTGELRDVEVFTGPIQRQGKTLLFSIIHDVTDRIKAEEMRHRVEGMIRHDLKSPLSGIIGLSSMLMENLPPGKTREWAEAIHEASTRTYTLIGLNLDIFKMEQGLYELKPERCDLALILRRLHREFTPVIGRDNLGMVLNLDGAPLPPAQELIVRGNPALLETLFANLLQNALEASSPDGTIAITVNTTRPAAAEDTGTIAIEIHNQGEVPPDMQTRFFQKYATSGKTDGTGIGTYSALLIAEAHGGAITFTSSQPDGTRVLVTLPILQA